MKINIEHIEERMFDYYEGNLSEQEKTDLLNLIHQHPEYEVEFTRWAQSYAHVDHLEPDYGLANQLLKKPVLSPYLNKYTVIVSFLLIFTGTLAYLYGDRTDQSQDSSVQTKQTIQTQNASAEEERSNTITSIQKSKWGNPVKENGVTSVSLLPELMLNRNMQPSGSAEDTLSLEAAKSTEPVVVVDKKQEVDTVGTKNAVTKPNTADQEKKKEKHKTKVSLKPTPDFIPTNPNF